ncbi:outer membrane beta-barrel protein [Sphingomonas sp. LY54]|uniref:outer membrane beta-barrel protein n=1 Tax=Sphingomonas sp. LY54 TaxID=3095343 RepID=UPI002D78165B|nr:outer membrane beta-barrel protein [Sphingomonas sp. LY54]WRP29988.1 outer membrane beta-barrel protein [Sphingomonas sp. LY54]
MKKIVLASVAALAFATPSFAADFTGPRVGGNVGLADEKLVGDGAFTYGAEVGYDHALAENAIVGITAEIQDTDDTGRELALTARVGGLVNNTALVYILGGYTNLNAAGFNFEGFKIGAGVEVAVTEQAFVKFEHRYANYDSGVKYHQNLVGVGFRF